jgi:2-iminobutanoate/2-iminopropanoate deaminase
MAAPGYSHAIVTGGSLLHVSAIAGLAPDTFEFDLSLDLLGQWRRVLENMHVLVRSAGATMHDVAMLRMYVVDVPSYRAVAREIGLIHREFFGAHQPAASLMGVAALGVDEALVEIEAVVQLRGSHA